MKRFGSTFIITYVLLFHTFISYAVKTSEYWLKGKGTESDPFLIESIEQLQQLQVDSKNGIYHDEEYFLITKDICHNPDLKNPEEIESFGDIPEGTLWNSIDQFNGVLDGGGHTISGLLGDAYSMVIGPFDSIYFIKNLKGVIRNLTINNSVICAWIGAGDINDSSIINCKNYATTRYGFCSGFLHEMIGCGNYGRSYYCGLASAVSTAINCYNYGQVTCKWRSRDEFTMSYRERGSGLFNQVYSALNCVNFGEVVGANEINGICWILDDRYGKQKFGNLVNYGNIISINGSSSNAIVNSFSYNYHTPNHKTNISHLFALSGTANSLVGSDKYAILNSPYGLFSEEYLKSEAFLSVLNAQASILDSRCCGWKRGKNGFPILEIINEDSTSVYEINHNEDISDPIYYNLQGIPVTNPNNGIFIKINGKKKEKVIIK